MTQRIKKYWFLFLCLMIVPLITLEMYMIGKYGVKQISIYWIPLTAILYVAYDDSFYI